jgi:hypothetical protein
VAVKRLASVEKKSHISETSFSRLSTEQFGIELTLSICIRKMNASNLSLNICYSDMILVGFVSFRDKFRDKTSIKLQPLSSKYFTVRGS